LDSKLDFLAKMPENDSVDVNIGDIRVKIAVKGDIIGQSDGSCEE